MLKYKEDQWESGILGRDGFHATAFGASFISWKFCPADQDWTALFETVGPHPEPLSEAVESLVTIGRVKEARLWPQ